MATELPIGSPVADALQNAVQSKLMELGWTSGGLDDTSLAEYIILTLANGKTEEELTTELVQELLVDISPEDTAASDFSRWLFQQFAALTGQATGQEATPQMQSEQQMPDHQQPMAQDADGDNQEMMDEDMDHSTGAQSDSGSMYDMPGTLEYIHRITKTRFRPTGPKLMRGGKQRDKRMLGQLNRHMDRTDSPVLHRIKGAAGRINQHNREPPKGPAPKGPRATMQRLANAPPPRQMAQQMQQMGPNNPLGQISQTQQMQLFAMYEQQAKMMAQILNPGQQQPHVGGFNPNHNSRPGGKSLFARVDRRTKQPNHNADDNADPSADSSMDVESGSQHSKLDTTTTICRFNLSCTRADCSFVHQSPAAPPGTAIDMTDTCNFGASCKNRKCTAKHPSPATLGPLGPALHSGGQHTTGFSNAGLGSAGPLGSNQHDSRPDCKYYPHCTNPACPFKHPNMPPCRNGANCTTAGCIFFHNQTACKFDPCLNPSCPFKHSEGQKRGNYRDKVWINPSSSETGEAQHVSERKFAEEGMEEELIRPEVEGQSQDQEATGQGMDAAQPEGIIT